MKTNGWQQKLYDELIAWVNTQNGYHLITLPSQLKQLGNSISLLG